MSTAAILAAITDDLGWRLLALAMLAAMVIAWRLEAAA